MTPIYITSVGKSGNNLNMSWLAQEGLVYRLQYKTSLAPAALRNDVSGDVTAHGASAGKTDTLPDNAGNERFYRVELLRYAGGRS